MPVTDDTPSLVLVLVGLGPRGAGLLERLVSNVASAGPERPGPVEVHLVDPYPVGGGRVWRSAQSELLRLNTTAEDLTAFVDDSVTMAGPVTPGPTLAEWSQTQGHAYFDFSVRRSLGRVPEGMTLVTADAIFTRHATYDDGRAFYADVEVGWARTGVGRSSSSCSRRRRSPWGTRTRRRPSSPRRSGCSR